MSNIATSNETYLDWLARNVHVWPDCILDGVFRNEIYWVKPNGEIKAAMARNPLHCYSKDQWLSRRAAIENQPEEFNPSIKEANRLAQEG